MSGEAESEPARVLGAADAVAIVVGAIVGVAIFFVPSRVASLVGTSSLTLLVWGLAGLISLAGALSFAELGGLYSGSGAQYEVLKDAYGRFVGFLFVFCNATAIQAGAIAIIALICASFLSSAVTGQAFDGDHLSGLAAMLIATVAVINGLGVRFGSQVQNATVLAKVGALLAIAVVALVAAPPQASLAPLPVAPASPALAVLSALVPAFFAYGGWQHALWISGEVKEPQRNVPRALVIGVLIVVGVYLAANAAYLRLLGVGGVAASKSLAFDAVAVLLPGAGRAVAVAVAISAFGVLNAQLLSGPRLLYGMAKDGMRMPSLARLQGPAQAPVPAIVAIAGMSLLMLLLNGREKALDKVITGVVFIDGLFFALTGAAVIVLRTRRATAVRPVKVPGYPLVPLFFVLGELGVVVGSYVTPDARAAAYIGAGWIVAGAVLYVARFRDSSESTAGV